MTPDSKDPKTLTFDEKGNIIFKSTEKMAVGKKARAKGGTFEAKVRKDLEQKGWIVDKWSNNVDLEKEIIHPAKRKYNPFRKVMTIGTGFPDFIAFKRLNEDSFNIIGVESKVNGLTSKEEKQKCVFLLNKKIFNEIWIATKAEERGKIQYINFKEKYKKLFI
jgi:hypothetical protein